MGVMVQQLDKLGIARAFRTGEDNAGPERHLVHHQLAALVLGHHTHSIVVIGV